MRRFLTLVERGQAVGFLEAGQTQREVANRFNVSQSAIGRLWQRFRANGSVEYARRPGRPRVTTVRQDRHMINTVLRNRFLNSADLQREHFNVNRVRISRSTVRRRLRASGLLCRRPAVRPPLTARHREMRLRWCRRHGRWNQRQWSRVLFTDESRFNLSFHDGRRRIYRRIGERITDATVATHDRFGGGSVMVWAGITPTGRTPLNVVEGYLTGQRYRDEILAPLAIPFLQAMHGFYGRPSILQDDNARPHRARIVTEFLQQQGVERMEWPACSPDLNPIEHAWDELGRRVYRRHPAPADLAGLRRALVEEWDAIPQAFFMNLIRSMRTRCTCVLDARGGYTRY